MKWLGPIAYMKRFENLAGDLIYFWAILLPRMESRRRNEKALKPELGILLRQRDNSFRLIERKRLEEDSPDDAIDSGDGARCDGKRQNT